MAALLLLLGLVAGAAPKTAPGLYESAVPVIADSQIDKLVFARLKELGIQPANLCSDSVFVRRAYLDIIGTLPTGNQARDFIADRNPNKRRALIDQMLSRDEFADYWA